MRARYRKTLIGFFWVILSPVLMYSVQAFVFQKILKINVDNYPLFLLGGLLPWIFISFTWDNSIASLVNSSSLIKGIQVSPTVVLTANIAENFVNFGTSFVLLLLPVIFYTQVISSHVFFLPLATLLLVAFVFLTTNTLAILYVFYRDVKYVVNFLMSLLFFMTPIFYPVSYIPEKYQLFLQFNPIHIMISPFRACIYGDTSINGLLIMFTKSVLLIFLTYLVWIIIWKNKRNELYLKI